MLLASLIKIGVSLYVLYYFTDDCDMPFDEFIWFMTVHDIIHATSIWMTIRTILSFDYSNG